MSNAKKFGTFAGVYTPSLLTILGVIMYMRLGWIVGNTTPLEFTLVVLFSHIISLTTGLSVSSIATDKKIEAGGIYYMLSRSLGLPIGGAIGLTIFVGTAASIALYLIGFSESFNGVMDWASSLNNLRFTATVALILITILAFVSTSVALKTQFIILGLIILSLISIFLGNFDPATPLVVTAPVDKEVDLSLVFAIFFPAVTGFTAGVAMSGDLEDSKKSIPFGTMLSIVSGLIIYFGLGIFLNNSIPEEYLKSDYGILLKFAAWSPLLIAGIWGATVSSALGGILGAPRILQALSTDKITPKIFGKGYGADNEPRNALLLTFLIAEAGILIGQLDVIAEIVSMFYLSAYGFINLACFLESWASTDFLPKFKIPKWVSLSGFIFTFIVMAYLNLIAMIVALLLIGGIFFYLTRKEIALGSGDVWQSVWSSLIKVALKKVQVKDEHKRNWKPNILLFSGGSKSRNHLIDFGRSVAGKNGMISNFDFIEDSNATSLFPKSRQVLKDELFEQFGIFSVHQVVKNKFKAIESIAETYGFSGVEPNTILMGWAKNTKDPIWFAEMTQKLIEIDYNLLYLDYDQERGFGKKETIDIWWNHFGDSADLTLQLVKLIQRSVDWRGASVNLYVVNSDFESKEKIQLKVEELLLNLRLDANVKIINNYQLETLYSLIESYSLNTDLLFVELPKIDQPNVFVQETNELFKHIGTTLLVGASSHFSDVLDLNATEIIFEQETQPDIVQSDLHIFPLNHSSNEELNKFIVDFDEKSQEYFTSFNQVLNQTICSFYSDFNTLNSEDLNSKVEHYINDVLAHSTQLLNKGLNDLLVSHKTYFNSAPKHLICPLTVDDITINEGDNKKERRAKKLIKFKSRFGVKPKQKIHIKALLTYYFENIFLDKLNKNLSQLIVKKTVLFNDLVAGKKIDVALFQSEINTNSLNFSRKYTNSISQFASNISSNISLEELQENSSELKQRKAIKQVQLFPLKVEKQFINFLKTLKTKAFLKESNLKFDNWFVQLKIKFQDNIVSKYELNLKELSQFNNAIKSPDLIRSFIKNQSKLIDLSFQKKYPDTLSVISKSQLIKFENELNQIKLSSFSQYNYIEHIIEKYIISYLNNEMKSLENGLIEKQNVLDNLIRVYNHEKSKENPAEKTLNELKDDIIKNVKSLEIAISEFKTLVNNILNITQHKVKEMLSVQYVLEHVNELKIESKNDKSVNVFNSTFIKMSNISSRFLQLANHRINRFIAKVTNTEKSTYLKYKIGAELKYQTYFEVRKIAPSNLLKIPFSYRNLFQDKLSSDDVYIGRIIEQKMAEEILSKIDNGISGAMYVTSELHNGLSTFLNKITSQRSNIISVDFSKQDKWNLTSFQSKLKNEVIQNLNESTRATIVFDSIESVFNSHIDVKIINELELFVSKYSAEHTIVLSSNILFYNLLKSQFQFNSNIFATLQLMPFSIDELHFTLWKRHELGNLSFKYANGVDESKLTERNKRSITKALHLSSGGNIGVALNLWLGVISFKEDLILNNQLFKETIDPIENLSWLLILEKIYIYKKVSISLIDKAHLDSLIRSQLVLKEEDILSINPLALNAVYINLKENGV